MEIIHFQTDIACLRVICAVISVVWLLGVSNVETFNIDVKSVKVLEGPNGSHFGYTLNFDENALKQNTIRLLVGAPKETGKDDKGNDVRSGRVHVCQYDGNKFACSKTLYDVPTFNAKSEQLDGEGFGSSLSVSKTGRVVTCAPFWKDTAHHSYTFVPGRCVSYYDEKYNVLAKYYHPKKQSRPYLPGAKGSQEYYHGLATYGFALDSTEGSTFAIGSPGLTIFEGGVDVTDIDPRNRKYSSTLKPFRNTLGTTAYGYLGYDVKFGKFCATDICLAAGAPNLKAVGMVRLYRWMGKEILYGIQEIEGDKTWSYFGSVLGAVDSDNDFIDELLIGAPYYSDSNSESFDSGRVYVYTKAEGEQYYKHRITLSGSGNKNSMFGSAIQPLGDINLDSYPDLVIGAPGEEDGTGCIYLYNGGQNGLSSEYTQRICANQIPLNGKVLKRFGATISKTTKIYSSSYPAFAVSSYLTDTVLMFTSRVIVRVKATMKANPNPIDLTKPCVFSAASQPCTAFMVCFQQRFQGQTTRKLDFLVRLDLDTERRAGSQQRVDQMDSAGKLHNSLGELKVSGVTSDKFCQEFVIVTKKSPIHKDRFTPIAIKVTMELDEAAKPSDIDPILDPTVPNSFSETVFIANDCSDNICNVDLSIQGWFSYSHKDNYPFIIVGHTKEISVDLRIKNNQETSYGTKVMIELDQPLVYLRFKSTSIKHCKTVSSASRASDATAVICNYYQPLRTNTSIEIGVIFNAVDVAMDKKWLQVSAVAMPTDTINSPEKSPEDNKMVMKTSVFIVADINVYGSSSPSEVTLKTAKRLSLISQEKITRNFTKLTQGVDPLLLNHKYQMKNLGPSFLPKTNVFLTIPAYLPDATQMVSDVTVQLKLNEEEATSCTDISNGFVGEETINPVRPGAITTTPIGFTVTADHDVTETTGNVGPQTTTEWTPGGGINKRRKKRSANGDFSKTYVLACQTSPEYCITFKCPLESSVPSGGHVELNVTLTVNKNNIPIPQDFSSFFLQLKTIVQEPRHLLFRQWDAESREQSSIRTSTRFHLVDSGGEINIWIIVGSIIAGLVLILLIAIICWKLGFFKRNKHYQVEEWKRKSMRMSKIPPGAAAAGTANGNDDL